MTTKLRKETHTKARKKDLFQQRVSHEIRIPVKMNRRTSLPRGEHHPQIMVDPLYFQNYYRKQRAAKERTT